MNFLGRFALVRFLDVLRLPCGSLVLRGPSCVPFLSIGATTVGTPAEVTWWGSIDCENREPVAESSGMGEAALTTDVFFLCSSGSVYLYSTVSNIKKLEPT
jgi:hypothetical protein